jgi:hypothetical protein
MLGIPIDLGPEFPADAKTILLTESAKADPDIVAKIEQQVRASKSVVVTSGLFKALQDKGIRDIVELTVTDRKASVQDFQIGWFGMHHAEEPVLVPHIDYMTNDSWEEISGQTRNTGHPILHSASYAEGTLYILTIPDNYDDLYKLPVEVLSRIRDTLLADLYVQVNGPAQVALFVYDNDTFVVESFLPEEAEIEIVVGEDVTSISDAMSGEALSGEPTLDWRGQSTGKVRYGTTVAPHALRVFRCKSGD